MCKHTSLRLKLNVTFTLFEYFVMVSDLNSGRRFIVGFMQGQIHALWHYGMVLSVDLGQNLDSGNRNKSLT